MFYGILIFIIKLYLLFDASVVILCSYIKISRALGKPDVKCGFKNTALSFLISLATMASIEYHISRCNAVSDMCTYLVLCIALHIIGEKYELAGEILPKMEEFKEKRKNKDT